MNIVKNVELFLHAFYMKFIKDKINAMTTKEKLIQILIDNGLFESQAEEVMEIAIPELNSLIENYSITWNRPSEEYPDVIYNILFNSMKPTVLKWIEENKPQAWFKPMFQ